MIKDYQNIIDAACERFNNSITQIDIVAWLENFDKNDWKKALIVLNTFEYYSTKDIIREFENGLKTIVERLKPKEKVALVPIGKIGKSGMAMIYYLKKTPSFSKKKVKLIEDNDFTSLVDDYKVVLVDDFSGTGGTIVEFYNVIKAKLPVKHSVIALTVAYMEKAKSVLEKEGIKIKGNLRIPAFAPRGSVFGYYPKMKAMRKFCFDYGDKLYSEKDYKEKKSPHHPLGFLNSQTLLGFEHSVPNNTLPIIWADKKIDDEDKKWTPLFPRSGSLIIERAKEFKQNQKYWASIIFKLGLNENLFSDNEKYNKQTLQLISIMFLKNRHKNVVFICQTLGINLQDYDNIIAIGQEKELFDLNEELTEHAIKIYEQIKKKIRFQKSTFIEPELIIEEDMLYIPKVFRGGS
jgi:hypothetical protein